MPGGCSPSGLPAEVGRGGLALEDITNFHPSITKQLLQLAPATKRRRCRPSQALGITKTSHLPAIPSSFGVSNTSALTQSAPSPGAAPRSLSAATSLRERPASRLVSGDVSLKQQSPGELAPVLGSPFWSQAPTGRGSVRILPPPQPTGSGSRRRKGRDAKAEGDARTHQKKKNKAKFK